MHSGKCFGFDCLEKGRRKKNPEKQDKPQEHEQAPRTQMKKKNDKQKTSLAYFKWVCFENMLEEITDK